MPIGIRRLNNPHPQPSSQIVFIKPLPGPTSAFAQDFLERIAAIAHPIMKANHLSITTLEEHEPNAEFIGRNFNAGEIIQLVLRARFTGQWLGFRQVQVVMMHELAHCVQMNHARAFWKVNEQFKVELRGLWGKGYTGDGLWGRGQTLLSGEYDTGRNREEAVLPRNLCGGTFRSSRRGKRKRREGGRLATETYAERQHRRIERKFGTGGVALGDDEDTKIKLENGKKVKGKPRVANSSRGRELRVAAALVRFGQQNEENTKKEEPIEEDTGSDESGYGDDAAELEAFELDGSRMRDGQGRGMVKVCEDENHDDEHVKQELEELQGLDSVGPDMAEENSSQYPPRKGPSPWERHNNTGRARKDDETSNHSQKAPASSSLPFSTSKQTPSSNSRLRPTTPTKPNCPICSLTNPPDTLVCTACFHVLDTTKMTRHWRCQSKACAGSQYINAADCGVCGICGARKPTDGS